MQQNPQQTPPDGFHDTRRGFNALFLLADTVAFPVRLCTTRFGTWGSRFLGPSAFLGFFWPIVFGGMYGQPRGLGFLLLYWKLSIILLIVHMIAKAKRLREGFRSHSRSWGVSWFDKPGADFEGQKSARVHEFFVVMLLGFLCFGIVSQPLGALFMWGAAAKLFVDIVTFQSVEARLRQMRDGQIETEFYVELHRQQSRNSREN